MMALLSRNVPNMKGDAMQFLRKSFFLSTILVGALGLTACPSKTTISKINSEPGRYRDKDIGLIGTVTDSYGVLGNGVYELDDGTGRIWVVTTRGVPSRGARVGVSGRVYTGLEFGGRNYGLGLKEENRETRSR
jgi:hypothetical protein